MLNIKSLIKRLIIIFAILYLILLVYGTVRKYVTLGEIIKSSLTGFFMMTVTIIYDTFFRKDITKKVRKINTHIKKAIR